VRERFNAERAYAPRPAQQANAARVALLARRIPRRASAPAWIEPEPPRLAEQLGLALEDVVGDSRA